VNLIFEGQQNINPAKGK
jgi:hypothetical protein